MMGKELVKRGCKYSTLKYACVSLYQRHSYLFRARLQEQYNYSKNRLNYIVKFPGVVKYSVKYGT